MSSLNRNTPSQPRIGVLALQGDFAEHIHMLGEIGIHAVEVRKVEQLFEIDGLIIPGGESTTIVKLLMRFEFVDQLRSRVESGMALWGTCAGMIVIARELADSYPTPLNLLDIGVSRNYFGRQVDSFEAEIDIEGIDGEAMRAAFLSIANERNLDIAFQRDSAFRRNRRLVVFDMDSTLIRSEVIDELATEAGVGEQVADITEQAMRGELDFNESFRARVALLKGLDEGALERVRERIQLTEGAERLVSTLRALGYRTAILSGGFTWFGQWLQQLLGIDYVHANELEIENGQVTGRVVGQIVNGQRKADLLKDIATQEGISLEQVIAVGDGANDLPMLGEAGLGIAFRAKPLVKQNAEQAISTLGLDGILYLIGVRDKDQAELLKSS